MWEDFTDRYDTNTLKSIAQQLKIWSYALALIPILVGSFLGALGHEFRLAPFLFLALTALFGKLFFAFYYGGRDNKGLVRAVESDYFFAPSRLATLGEAARGVLLFTGALMIICGLILCLISGWGLLSFGVLAALCWAAVAYGYDTKIPGARQLLVFFGEVFLLTAAAYYSQRGYFTMSAFTISLPIGLLAAALVTAAENEQRRRHQAQGLQTLALKFDHETANKISFGLLVVAYIFILLNALYGVTNLWPVLLFLLLPLVRQQGFRREREVASFYIKFGFLYALALLLQFAL